MGERANAGGIKFWSGKGAKFWEREGGKIRKKRDWLELTGLTVWQAGGCGIGFVGWFWPDRVI